MSSNGGDPRKRVAVVVPLRDDPDLTRDEEISFRHLEEHLGDYERYLVAPESLELPRTLRAERPGYRVVRFPNGYFGSAERHNRLMLSRFFYETFQEYEYILLYHTDALVFSDRLLEWCDRGYDYVGAPWPVDPEDPEKGFSRVGNGGFSLRRIQSFLDVFDSHRPKVSPEEWWQRHFAGRPWWVRGPNLPRRFLKRFRRFNGVRWHMAHFVPNEDYFWADHARRYHPGFRIPDPETALGFAWERVPRHCFERNGGELPFGCHAWARWDREFWEPYLLRSPSEEGSLQRMMP